MIYRKCFCSSMFHHFPSVRLDCISCALGAYSKTKTKTPRGNMFQEPRSQGFQRFNPGLVHQSKQVSKDSLGATELKMLKPMNPLNEIQDVHFPHEPSGCSPRFRLPATTPSHPKKKGSAERATTTRWKMSCPGSSASNWCCPPSKRNKCVAQPVNSVASCQGRRDNNWIPPKRSCLKD